VLERGPSVEHIKITQQRLMSPWDFKHRTHLTQKEEERPIQSSHCNAGDKHFYVKTVNILMFKLSHLNG
jgi:hypothetical protein